MASAVRRLLRLVLAVAGGLAVLIFAAWFALLRAPVPEPPALAGRLAEGSLRVGGIDRHFIAYVPPRLASPPPLLLVLHGSMGDGAQMRAASVYGFDVLADRDGFAVAYPDGFEGHWNDCRGAGPNSANAQDIDDPAFLAALVDHLAERLGIDRDRVYATGLSNGGHMSLRLALERPDLVAGVAAVAANLPDDANLDCAKSGRPVAVLLVNGTADPMNPWAGGRVALYGVWGNRGTVRGHSFPNRTHPYPRFIGRTNADVDGAEEIWRFLSRQRR